MELKQIQQDRDGILAVTCGDVPGAGGAVRECANGDCGWRGTTDRYCGSVGPLCPDCGEVTE